MLQNDIGKETRYLPGGVQHELGSGQQIYYQKMDEMEKGKDKIRKERDEYSY